MRSLHWAVCAIVGLLAGTARAAENGFYIGAAGGDTETQHQTGVGDIYDDQDSSFKVIGGWRPFDWFALEGGYFDLGNVTLHEAVPGLAPFRLEQEGYDVFGVFLIEIVNFDLFAKAGVVISSADLTTSLPGGSRRARSITTRTSRGARAHRFVFASWPRASNTSGSRSATATAWSRRPTSRLGSPGHSDWPLTMVALVVRVAGVTLAPFIGTLPPRTQVLESRCSPRTSRNPAGKRPSTATTKSSWSAADRRALRRR